MKRQNKTVLQGISHLSVRQIFECGQTFRFNPAPGGGYEGVARGRYLKVTQEGENVVFSAPQEEVETVWRAYFDLDRDYGSLIRGFSGDEVLQTAAAFGSGIRILQQETFECVISFILSQCNSIPRIKGIIARLCESFGEELQSPDGRRFYTFPTPERLRDVSVEELGLLRAGFRAKYVRDAVRKINDCDLDLTALPTLSAAEGRRELKKIAGVGDKVADCILLFGAGKLDAFPVDTWVRKALSGLYGGILPDFGPYAGLAQQYLFYYARENKIAVSK